MSPQVPAPQKGLRRVVSAFHNSLAGFISVWREPAFRQEAVLAVVLLPASFWVGQSWLETAMLCTLVVLVLVTEILNTAIEAVVDRIGPEWNTYSKAAKDLGSAAVLLCLLLCSSVWAWALWERLA